MIPQNFIESIKVEENRIWQFEYHLDRISRTLKDQCGIAARINFDQFKPTLESLAPTRHKLRIIYNSDYCKYTCTPYKLKEISSLRVVISDSITYEHKYEDRQKLDKLYLLRRHYDDILICKNGLITDSHYCNVALLREGLWYTPRKPLLPGTCRARLLDDNRIHEADISADSLHTYEQIRLFNALMDFGEVELEIGRIFS